MRSRRRGIWSLRLTVLLAAAVLAFPVLLRPAGAAGRTLAEGVTSRCRVLLFSETDSRVLLVYSDRGVSTALSWEPSSGVREDRTAFSDPVYWAASKDGGLFVLGGSSGAFSLRGFSPRLRETLSRELPFSLDDLRLTDCSPGGVLYGVTFGAPEVLFALGGEGAPSQKTFSGRIEFLAVTPGGRLLVWAESRLFLSEDGSLSGLTAVPCSAAPAALLGEDLLLDRENTVCRLSAGGVSPLFRCPAGVYDDLLPCPDGRGGLLVPESAGRVSRYSLTGNLLETFSVGGSLLGLSPSGALCLKDGSLCFTELAESPSPAGPTEAPGPSASPTPAPTKTPAPLPLPDPEVRTEEEYLILSSGATVSRLLELFRPEPVLVRTADGQTVTSGRLCTGMTAGGYTVVIPGDCTGNGLVNSGDIHDAQAHVLRSTEITDPAFLRALDLDGDGSVTAADLVLLDGMISG